MKKSESLDEKTARLRAQRLAAHLEVRMRSERSYPVTGLDDQLPFGKHQGKLLRDVIEEDIGWVVWALESIETFSITSEAEAELDVARDVRRPPRAWE